MEPTSAHAKGDPRTGKSKKGKVLHHPPWPGGIWILESSLERERPLEDHLRQLVERLEPKASVLKSLKQSGLELDIFCGCFLGSVNEGLKVSPGVLERLGRLGLQLGLDIYAV